jgi:hypothetical protein
MRNKQKKQSWLLAGAAFLLGTLSAAAHIGYGGRDFGVLVPNASPVTLVNQTVTGNYGWADGTDDDFADSHRLRAFRFTLSEPALVTITFSGSTNATSATPRDGSIKPGFSVFRGLANLEPRPEGHSADHDGSAISLAYLATLPGPVKKGAFRSLQTWRIGGDFQQGPAFDFEDPATGLSTFTFMGYAVDGDASLFGGVAGIIGDGKADGTVTGTFQLEAGDYSIFVGGANYQGQFAPVDSTLYGLTGSVSAVAFSREDTNPRPSVGIPYNHRVTLGSNQSGGLSNHVGAWSWQDSRPEVDPDTGWTHTSNWVALRLQQDTVLTVTLSRDANVPWPSVDDPERKADTSSMFPSLTLYRGWQEEGDQGHDYFNKGAIAWAPGLTYVDHVDNSTAETITRTWFLAKGEYSFALGSHAPANNNLRQGFHIQFTTGDNVAADPVPTQPVAPGQPGIGGIGYAHTVNVRAGSTGQFSNHVGAWSWEDSALFGNPGQGVTPVGWTHTSRWMALNVDEEEVLFTIKLERDANVPWLGQGNLNGKADISSLFPSFTVWRNWHNSGPDSHIYNNRGNVSWAAPLRYLTHVDNSTAMSITHTLRLKRGQYSFAIGSNAPANNTLRQGFKLSYSAVNAAPEVIMGDPMPGGIGYRWMVSAGAGSSGSVSEHVGSWSWEDARLFGGPNQPEFPVGWTHHSRWLALEIRQPLAFTVTMSRNSNVPWPSVDYPNRKAAVNEMFPSLTLWRGWFNNGADSHSYHNRGNVDWAPSLNYVDHIDNTAAESITRTWTLQPGQYTIAMGSNSRENTVAPQRQGFTFAWSTSLPQWSPPVITRHPRGATVVAGRPVTLTVQGRGENLQYQWFKNGRPVPNANSPLYQPSTAAGDSALYTAEVRNAAGWLHSAPATVTVIAIPELVGNADLDLDLAAGVVGQPYAYFLGGAHLGQLRMTGLPRGLRFSPQTNVIAGVPMVFGTFPVTIQARNAAGSDSIQVNLVIAGLPEGTVATFTGSLGRAPLLNQQLGGHIQLHVSATAGFTAVIKLGNQTLRRSGGLVYGGGGTVVQGSLAFDRRGQSPVTVSFNLLGQGHAMGTISDGRTTLPFAARARATASEAATFAGPATFAMAPELGSRGLASLPQGYSLGGVVYGTNGNARGSMVLADNSRFTFSAPVETGGNLSVFRLLYKNSGSLVGVLNQRFTGRGSDMGFSEVSWFKAPQPERSKDRLYKLGIPPVDLEVLGGSYAPNGDLRELLTIDNEYISLKRLGRESVSVTLPERSGGRIQGGAGALDSMDIVVIVPKAPSGNGNFALAGRGVLSTGKVVVRIANDELVSGTVTGLIVPDGGQYRLLGFGLIPTSAGRNSPLESQPFGLFTGADQAWP